jgi:heat shock protein HslJ
MNVIIKSVFLIALVVMVYGCCRKPVAVKQNPTINQNARNNSILFDQSWKLIEINNISVQSGSETSTPYMVLKQGSQKVSGNGGCNSFSGIYSVEGTSLRFSNFIATKMACDKLDLEYQFFRLLKQCEQYQIVQDTLILSDSLDHRIASFKMNP